MVLKWMDTSSLNVDLYVEMSINLSDSVRFVKWILQFISSHLLGTAVTFFFIFSKMIVIVQ